jgi:holliday junction DNA helicase RuvB
MNTRRTISPEAEPEESVLDRSLRPQRLDDVIGQERVRENLRILIEASLGRNEALEHVLFYGPPGLGKTTLAHILAREMGANIRITAGPSIERAGDLAAILSNLHEKEVLFIDECHRLGKVVEEILYPAMEEFALDLIIGQGPGARSVRLDLPHFTVVGATTRLALLSAPLRTRFGAIHRLDFYDQASLEKIVERAARALRVPLRPEGREEIARRGRGTPRVALRVLRRVRDYAQVRGDGIITLEIANEALSLLEIDGRGLDDLDRRVLHAIIGKFGGGPVGLDTIAASIGEAPDTIMDVVEPYLLQLGFIERTPRGRTATRLAYEHLGMPDDRAEQGRLFNA